MKIDVILVFTFLIVQTSATATLFGRLRGAMSNVERGFGKLLSDVVFDVKDTLHCTISAVEQVLAKNGLLEETSDYNRRCRGYARPKTPKSRGYGFRSFFEKRFQPTTQISPESEFDHLSKELETSVINVNNSVNDIFRKREGDTKFKDISDFLKEETDRLNAVSDLLKRELENLSINVRNEILKLHISMKKHPEDTIWEDLKALHYFKSKSKDTTEIKEITNIIDKVVSEMYVTPNDKVLSEDEKLEEIQKRLNKYKTEIQNDEKGVLNAKEAVETKISTDTEIKSFKDLAQTIMNNDNRVIKDNKIPQIFQEEATPKSSKVEKSLFGVNMDSSSPFYDKATLSETLKIVEDAKTIMEESRKSEELLNNFFGEPHVNADVFNNVHLFNFD